ncbi:MAG: hypothetical protein HXX16_18250 [Bacteroidales bacterium]|nr:hypothetical protein [Bacteroidales bacterium]
MRKSNNIFWIALSAIVTAAISVGLLFYKKNRPINRDIIRLNDITEWIKRNKKDAAKCYATKVSELPNELLQKVIKTFGNIENPQTSLWLTLTDSNENILQSTVIQSPLFAEDVIALLGDNGFTEITI